MKEYLLSTDSFSKPKEIDGNTSIYVLLKRLILLEPGTFQTHPEMGVGLLSRWRYKPFDELDELRDLIQEQIETYLPIFTNVNVTIYYNEGISNNINIDIRVNDSTVYNFMVKTEDDGQTVSLVNL